MGIDLMIVAGKDKGSSSIKASGSIQHVITSDERDTFKLGDVPLKDAVNAYFGQRPKDAYLSSPTPWGDLYKTYKWPQVQTVLAVEKAEILGITSQPVIVKTQEFSNHTSNKATFNVSISDQVQNTTTSTWSVGGTLSITQEITVGVNFIGEGEAGRDLSYSQSWGVGGEHSKSITIGSTAGVSVDLKPGESIKAALSASRGVLKARVVYKSYLIGSTAVNYDKGYKGHHFWALPIGSVMSAGKISNEIKSTQDIEVGYYSNSKVELLNKIK